MLLHFIQTNFSINYVTWLGGVKYTVLLALLIHKITENYCQTAAKTKFSGFSLQCHSCSSILKSWFLYLSMEPLSPYQILSGRVLPLWWSARENTVHEWDVYQLRIFFFSSTYPSFQNECTPIEKCNFPGAPLVNFSENSLQCTFD